MKHVVPNAIKHETDICKQLSGNNNHWARRFWDVDHFTEITSFIPQLPILEKIA